jgi:hypothetical protein
MVSWSETYPRGGSRLRSALIKSFSKGMAAPTSIPGVPGGLFWQGTTYGDGIFIAGNYVVYLDGIGDPADCAALSHIITPKLT